MKKVILSVMMVFALGTAVSFAQSPEKGCGGCKAECTAQQKAQCHDAGTAKKENKKEECKSKTCDDKKKDCDKSKKECAKKETKKTACCKKDAAKK
ncbi:MAG: hypothetical protein ACRCSQ_07865 [Bacteroidales bacterium]